MVNNFVVYFMIEKLFLLTSRRNSRTLRGEDNMPRAEDRTLHVEDRTRYPDDRKNNRKPTATQQERLPYQAFYLYLNVKIDTICIPCRSNYVGLYALYPYSRNILRWVGGWG
jgi:hypothetical protein